MSCSRQWLDAGEARVQSHERREVGVHVLFVHIPTRSARARRWALARGIGDVDVAALTAMLRAERLSAG